MESPTDKGDVHDDDLKHVISGGRTIISKSAFTDNDIPTLDYDSIFGGQIVDKIKRLVPHSFTSARTVRYLLEIKALGLGLERVINNQKNVVIVSMGIGQDVIEVIEKSGYKNIHFPVPNRDHSLQGVVFVIKNSDLPSIVFHDLQKQEVEESKLELIKQEINLYASVIDLSESANSKIREQWASDLMDELDFKVQLSIGLIAILHWKKNRTVVQINLVSGYKEQGIQSDINEVLPIR